MRHNRGGQCDVKKVQHGAKTLAHPSLLGYIVTMRLTKTQPAGLKIKTSRASLRFSFLFVLAAAFAAAQCTNNNLYDALANPGGGQGSNGPYQEMLPVFVSSVSTTGNFGGTNFSTPWSGACSGQSGFAMADCACNQMAQAANLPTLTYVAWVSTQGDDMTCRIQNHPLSNCALPPGGGPTWADTMGRTIAQGYAELFSGTLRNPIEYTENMAQTSGNVWTGTAETGTVASSDHCSAWSDGTASSTGLQGSTLDNDSNWTNANPTASCVDSKPIYCFGVK